ncbi:MAG TPA: nicotinate phosphoribosyltransferase [Dehalococcoidia bacterium]|nr:nicotinate phosphoribosyltransferase [Dehalococcoidia bacterium]
MPPAYSPALFTDLYELTMAQAYWQAGKTATGTFSLSIRNYPPDRAYFVLAGIDDILAYLEELSFNQDDVEFLESLRLFDSEFLEFLRGLRFTGSVRAMPEGTIFFANEPVIEVTAPVIEGQIVETFAINRINLQSLLATKASRVVHAARSWLVVDFGARRAHGIDAADQLARTSYLAGFGGSSNLQACARFAIPAFGTMAHAFVTTFDREQDAFVAYARSFPDTSTFLVDSYDTIEGVRNAVSVALRMKEEGHGLVALRLDSGDIGALAREARRMLDEVGLEDVQVFASGGLDEFEIDELLASGAPIGGFGVGTKVGVSADAPWTDCTYKLVEYAGRPLLKLSSGKETLTGPKQVFRSYHANGDYEHDVIGLSVERRADGEPLLEDVMRDGRRLRPKPDLRVLRERFSAEFGRLPEPLRALHSPDTYPVEISDELRALQDRITLEVKERELGESV